MIAAAAIAARRRNGVTADDVAPRLEGHNVRVDAADLPTLDELSERHGGRVVFSRIMRGDTPGHPGTVAVATDDMRPQPGDILTVIGDADEVAQITAELGHPSTVALTLDRSALDYRRITVSARAVEGRTLGSLRLERRYGATATRVRRGDIDVLATGDLSSWPNAIGSASSHPPRRAAPGRRPASGTPSAAHRAT